MSQIISSDISDLFCHIAASALILDIFYHTCHCDRSGDVVSSLTDEPSALYAVCVILAFLELRGSGLAEHGNSVDLCRCAGSGRVLDDLDEVIFNSFDSGG